MRFSFAVIPLVFFASAAFAQNMAQLHQCYGQAGEAGIFKLEAIGKKGNQVFISQKSVTDKSFLIFNDRNIYRCAYPKENVVKNIFDSCHENASNEHRYNVHLKAGANTYTGVIEVSKSKPVHIKTSENWVYQTPVSKHKSICRVTCTEELTGDTSRLIKTEIGEHIAGSRQRWAQAKVEAERNAITVCNDLAATVKREVSNLFLANQTSDTDCFNENQRAAIMAAEDKRQKAISALKYCGGELQELALHEIAEFEGRRSSSVTADGDPESDDDTAFGKR